METTENMTGTLRAQMGGHQPIVMAIGGGQASNTGLWDTTNTLDTLDAIQMIMETDMKEDNIVLRRLTPTECARLQGMPDWWCDGVPHTDSAEYKMWGNGMALPCVLYVMEGIKDVLDNGQTFEIGKGNRQLSFFDLLGG